MSDSGVRTRSSSSKSTAWRAPERRAKRRARRPWPDQTELGFAAYASDHIALNVVATDATCRRKDGKDGIMLFPHQDVIRTLTMPDTSVRRLLVIHRTGSGKTQSMLAILDNKFTDMRNKIVVFPTQKIADEFYAELIHSPGGKYRKWLLTKMHPDALSSIVNFFGGGEPPPGAKPDDRRKAKDARRVMIDLLAMKGRLRRRGEDGELHAPIRVFTYGQFASSLMRTGRHAMTRSIDGSPPYSNSIVIMDEIHTLIDPNVDTSISNRNEMIERLKVAMDMELYGFTATPVVDPNEERAQDPLLSIIKGNYYGKAPDHNFISYFNSSPNAMYPSMRPDNNPEVAINLFLTNAELVTEVPMPILRAGSLREKSEYLGNKYMSKFKKPGANPPPAKSLLRMQRYCNHTNYHGNSKSLPASDKYNIAAPKICALAKDLKNLEGKALIMVNNAASQQTLVHLLRLQLFMEHCTAASASESPCYVSILKADRTSKQTISQFNEKRNRHGAFIKALIVDTREFSEGVSFKGVRHLYLLNPAVDYKSHMQQVGRTLRMCAYQKMFKSPREWHTEFTIYCSTLPDRVTADEMALELVRSDAMATTERMHKYRDMALDRAFLDGVYHHSNELFPTLNMEEGMRARLPRLLHGGPSVHKRTLQGHVGWVTALAACERGKLASGSADNTIKIWDVVTGECERTLDGHTDGVKALVACAGGKLASGSRDETIKIWNVATGQCERTLEGHGSLVMALAACAGGKLASGSWNGAIKIWDVATGQCERTLEGHYSRVMALAACAGGKLASGSAAYPIKIWDVATGKCERTLQGHVGWVTALAACERGKLASGSGDKTIKIWDVATGKCERTLQGHTGWVRALAACAGGKLVSGSEDKTIKIWDVATEQCERTLGNYTDIVGALAAFANGELASADRTTIKIWGGVKPEAPAPPPRRLKLPPNINTRIATFLSDPVPFAVARAPVIKDEHAAMRETGCLSAYNEWLGTVPRPPRWLGVDMEMNTGEPRPSPVMGWGAFVVMRARRIRFLHRGPIVCKRTLEGHAYRVRALAACAGGKLASGSYDESIMIWDVATGQCERTLEGHTSTVLALAACAGGKLASGSTDKTIKIWDVSTGQCERTLRGHTNCVNALAACAGGKLASGSDDYTIKIWDVATGQCESTLEGHMDWVLALAAFPDGKLASGSEDETIKIWDVATGQCERTLEGHTDFVTALVACAGGKLASGSGDDTIKVWDVATGVCERTLRGHTGPVRALAAWPGIQLASGSEDKTIKIWDLETGQCERTLGNYTDIVRALAAFANGELASADRTTIKIWAGEGERTRARRIRLLHRGPSIHKRTLEGHAFSVRALAVCAGGKLASGSDDQTIKIWDTATRQCERTLEGHGSLVFALAACAGGKLASGSRNGAIKIWDVATGQCERTLEGHYGMVSALAALPGGKLASGSDDKTIKVWNMATGQCERTLQGHTGGVNALAACAGGKLASGAGDKTIKIWDLATGQCERTLEGHTSGVSALAACAGGKLASGSQDYTIKVWDMATGQCERTLEGHTRGVYALAAWPGGRLASGSGDKTIKLWDVATGKCERTLDHTGHATVLAAFADGELASADSTTIKVWGGE